MKLETLKDQGRKVLPSMFTIGNMAFGFFAMLAASDGNFHRAGWFLIGGIFCDTLDGRIARLVHAESEFGAEFDSMADFCAFGIAPAYIMYEFTLKDYGGWGYPIAFLYALCVGLRLARFNLEALHGTSSKDYFEGLPSPAGAGILASFVLIYTIFEQGRPIRTVELLMNQLPYIYVAMPGVMIVISLLMVSSVPYPAFKGKGGARPRSVRSLIVIIGMLSLLFMYPHSFMFVFGSVYLLAGLATAVWKLVRGRKY